ncbi:MAG: 30S ribosome-binding factor RbfA [Syntrophomonas sp.]
MSKRRQERMSVEVKRVLSRIIQEDIKDPRIDFSSVSITRVDVSNDYSHARVNISILGDEAKQEETMKALQKARGYIRTELAKEIQVRHAPELEFRLDRSIEHGIRISSLLEELKEEEKKSSDE